MGQLARAFERRRQNVSHSRAKLPDHHGLDAVRAGAVRALCAGCRQPGFGELAPAGARAGGVVADARFLLPRFPPRLRRASLHPPNGNRHAGATMSGSPINRMRLDEVGCLAIGPAVLMKKRTSEVSHHCPGSAVSPAGPRPAANQYLPMADGNLFGSLLDLLVDTSGGRRLPDGAQGRRSLGRYRDCSAARVKRGTTSSTRSTAASQKEVPVRSSPRCLCASSSQVIEPVSCSSRA